MASFQDILDQPVTQVDRPKPTPVGTYLFLVDGQPKMSQIGQNKTDVIDFNLKILQVMGDSPSPAEVEEFGGVAGKPVRARFFITEPAKWRLDKFLYEDLGIAFGMPRKQAIAEALGKQVIGQIIHRPNESGDQMFAELRETSKT